MQSILEGAMADGILPAMSIAELKETAERLTARERMWLRCYLAAVERSSTPEWKTRMAAKRGNAKAGRAVSPVRYAKTAGGKIA